MKKPRFTKTLCIDFDGVLHSYTSGWQGVGIAGDPPVEGAIPWLRHLVALYAAGESEVKPVIYSSRSKSPEGIAAMRRWLHINGLSDNVISQLEFPTEKPAAWLTLDDRAICFTGTFPPVERIANFVPWNKK